MMIEIGIKAAANDKNMRKRDVLYGPHPKLNIMLSIRCIRSRRRSIPPIMIVSL